MDIDLRKGNFIYTTECSGNIVVAEQAVKKIHFLTFSGVAKIW
jgi:hypothetical protein